MTNKLCKRTKLHHLLQVTRWLIIGALFGGHGYHTVEENKKSDCHSDFFFLPYVSGSLSSIHSLSLAPSQAQLTLKYSLHYKMQCTNRKSKAVFKNIINSQISQNLFSTSSQLNSTPMCLLISPEESKMPAADEILKL